MATSADEIVKDLTAELKHLTIGDQIKEISKRLENTTDELHQQVREKHQTLLQQATHAGRFDTALSALSEDVQQTQNAAHRLKSQFDKQYNLLKNQTTVQSRLHQLLHLLRSAGTVQTLSAKLRNTKDILKQAEIHFELSQLIEDNDLQDISFIQPDLAYVLSSNQKIRNLTQMQLMNGLQERNEIQVVNALKVFMNLNTLEKSLDNLVATYLADIEQSLKECFKGNDITVQQTALRSANMKANGSGLRGPGKTPQLTTTQNFRAKFWKSFHWLIYEELYEFCNQIMLLKRAMEKINDIYTDENCVKMRFWESVQNLLKKSFDECPQHVVQTLQEGLSKVIASVRGLEERLNGEFLFNSENLFASLRAGYINKCAANMKACLSGIDLPCNETVDNLVRIASGELSAALIDVELAEAFANIFVASGQELCTKLEAQIKLGAETTQIVDVPNIQQQQNIVVANVLHYYKDSVRHMLRDLSRQLERSTCKAHEIIDASLNQPNLLIGTILQQIVDSMNSAVNVIILSMHREPGLNSDRVDVTTPSLYMKELQDFLNRAWTNHINPFSDKEMTSKCGNELAKRCIELFIHNACIIRPLSNAGRKRLKHDSSYMEQALKAICGNFSVLGKSARLLRAFSLLIVQDPQELAKQNIGKDVLVPSYIVLLLLFAHAGSEVQSPHTTACWSNERLIEWLDGHTSERERLELISGALQRYRGDAKRKNIQQYDVVYPIIVEIFERALSAIS